MGIGVGGRHEDYHAVGADPATQTMRGMAERVAVMKRVWAGEKLTDSVLPVGPAPVQPGGPPLFVGSIGPEDHPQRRGLGRRDWPAPPWIWTSPSRTSCSTWRGEAWAQAGRPKPHLVTSFWFAFGSPEQARAQVHRHLRRYMNWIPAEYVDAMAPMTGWAGSEDELLAVLRKFEGIGTDEVQLIPTSSDVDQLRRAADVAGGF